MPGEASFVSRSTTFLDMNSATESLGILKRIPSVIEHVIKKARDNGGTAEVAQSDRARY